MTDNGRYAVVAISAVVGALSVYVSSGISKTTTTTSGAVYVGGLAGLMASALFSKLLSGTASTIVERTRSVPGAAPPMAKYSQVVEVRGGGGGGQRTVFLSGQTGHAVNGELMGATAEEQVDLCFSNIKAALIELGLTVENLVKITVFLTSRDDLATYRAARDRALGDVEPASTLVIADLVHPDMKVEIEAIAVA